MWTDERVAELKRLWAEGASASQIARALGGVTRNAVIGKVHRLGLVGRALSPRERPTPTSPPAVRAPRPLPEPEPDPPADMTRGRLTVENLRATDCRWPIGDPRAPDFHFCGLKKEDSLRPYCEAHNRKAWSRAGVTAEDRAKSREALLATGQRRAFG